MKFANIVLASAVGVIASVSFAQASVQNSAKLDCSVVTGGIKDSSQLVGFTLIDEAGGSVQMVSVEGLKEHGCTVRLVPNYSENYSEISGSIFIEMKGTEIPFGYMLSGDTPKSCNGRSTVDVPLRFAHVSPEKIINACLRE